MKYLIEYNLFENKKESTWFIFKDLMRMYWNDAKKKGLIGSIKDTIYHSMDKGKDKIYLDLVDFIRDYNHTELDNLLLKIKKYRVVENEFKEECGKEYSELKYELAEWIAKEQKKLIRERSKVLDDIIMKYYELTNRELLVDIDEGINYFKTSKYINQNRWKEISSLYGTLLSNYKVLLSISDIHDKTENILNNIK